MKKYFNKAEINGGNKKFICPSCNKAYYDYDTCPNCNLESDNSDITKDIFIFSDCFSYHNGKPDQMAGYTTIVTNERFELEDEYNIEYIETKGFNNATNNFGELMGILAGLEYLINEDFLNAYETVHLVSDSEYVILGIRERMYKWKRNGWTNTSGKVKNLEIWQKIYDDVSFIKNNGIIIECIHQRGHQGKSISKKDNPIIYLQEKCDTLSVNLKKELIKRKEENNGL